MRSMRPVPVGLRPRLPSRRQGPTGSTSASRGTAASASRRKASRFAARLREAFSISEKAVCPFMGNLPIICLRSGNIAPFRRIAIRRLPCFSTSGPHRSAVPQARAMPCWRACGPARWGRRSSYGNGFGNFSRYITEPRDLPSESSRPTPDIRLFALIRAIVSPWKGVSEPPSSDTVKYRKFSSIPLPCPKKQGDAGGRRRAIAGLHGALPPGCAAIRCGPGEPPIDAPAARASQGGRPVLAVEPGERRDRAASTCLPCAQPARNDGAELLIYPLTSA